jgi:hypothetical protein
VRGPGGLTVGLKRGRKTVERKNLIKQKIVLAAGAESEIDTGTGIENALLRRKLHSLCFELYGVETLILE